MTNIKCPWCGSINEYEVWELKVGERFEDEQCPDCEKWFGYYADMVPKWFAIDVKKVSE